MRSDKLIKKTGIKPVFFINYTQSSERTLFRSVLFFGHGESFPHNRNISIPFTSLTDVAQVFADELPGVAFRGKFDVHALVFVHFQGQDFFAAVKLIEIRTEVISLDNAADTMRHA